MTQTATEFLDEMEAVLGPNGENWCPTGPGALTSRGRSYCIITAAAQSAHDLDGIANLGAFGTFCNAANRLAKRHWPDRVTHGESGPLAGFNDHPDTDFTDVQHFMKYLREELCS